jgi:hypothetical protein
MTKNSYFAPDGSRRSVVTFTPADICVALPALERTRKQKPTITRTAKRRGPAGASAKPCHEARVNAR